MSIPAESRVTDQFFQFLKSEKAGGLILLACTILSLGIANSSAGAAYIHFWHHRLDLSFSFIHLNHTVEEWLNDGFMTLFFLMVGLEIERELYAGELSDPKNALLPILAALGGMAIPALVHWMLNRGSSTQPGIGIPMATDIAFSLGMLSLLGKRVPISLKIFLTALAILDDLGAVVIIGIFYSRGLSLFYLGSALAVFGLLILFNRLRIDRIWIYCVGGILLWYFMLQSGVHATLAGVLLAFAIPFRRKPLDNLSQRVEHILHKPVSLLIVPLFALANTGIRLMPGWFGHLSSANSLGILLGLVLGKPAGIFGFCLAAARFRLCRLPDGVSWWLLLGAGGLAGIGFTMSIFISNLAFADHGELIESSKIAVLAASLIAIALGLSLLGLPWKTKSLSG
jgi:NhaA family Na+:H+ antiporter